MKNIFKINKVVKKDNRVDFEYEVSGEWKKYFNLNESFFLEYSEKIIDVPESILVIPLICNILPIVWLTDAEIVVDEIDSDFLECIKDLKKGYSDMYPTLDFFGTINNNKKIKNKIDNDNSLAFFSGGVDAFNTLFSHIKEKPTLLTVWGADIKLKDFEGWKNVETHLKEVSKTFQLENVIIKSNLKEFIDHLKLQEISEKAKENWWHGFQHGIGIISLAAPMAYALGALKIYFASSFTIKDKGKITCASDPTIDNYLKIANATVIHDGYEFCRQDKIHNIVKFVDNTKKNIRLRVCWQDSAGKNCCACEKCSRTMLGIFAENKDPHNFGFDYTKKNLQKIKYLEDSAFGKLRYEPIQIAMKKNCKIEDLPKEIRWFYHADINKLNYHPIYNFLRKTKRKIIKKS